MKHIRLFVFKSSIPQDNYNLYVSINRVLQTLFLASVAYLLDYKGLSGSHSNVPWLRCGPDRAQQTKKTCP